MLTTEFCLGFYTDLDNPLLTIPQQKQQLQQAMDRNLPFALYMTLNPNATDAAAIVGNSLSVALSNKTFIFPALVEPLAGLSFIAIQADHNLGWEKLYDLSQRLDRDLQKHCA